MSVHLIRLQPEIIGRGNLEHLERPGLPCRRVKRTGDFENLAGLILPGGESTGLALHRYFSLKCCPAVGAEPSAPAGPGWENVSRMKLARIAS